MRVPAGRADFARGVSVVVVRVVSVVVVRMAVAMVRVLMMIV